MFSRYRGGGGGGGADNSITQMAVMDVSILIPIMKEEEEELTFLYSRMRM